MLLFDQILQSENFQYQVQFNVDNLKLLTECWSTNLHQNVENPEFLLNCFQNRTFENETENLVRVKRDENIMKKIVAAYSDVFGSSSKTQKK